MIAAALRFSAPTNMSEIKLTVSLLCKYVNLLFNMNIKSETFRLAKFNKSDDHTVELFWSLLSNALELPPSNNNVQQIKRFYLVNLKYESPTFYSLPHDMSSGSRELLIAFAYLLATNHLGRLVEKRVANSPLHSSYQASDDNANFNLDNLSFNLNHFKCEEDFKHAIAWIRGRLEHNKKAILEYRRCFEKMCVKCSKLILDKIPHIEQLSVLAILAVNNPEHAKIFLQRTDHVMKILEIHEQWLKKQSTFWEWMNSVIREKQQDVHATTNSEELKLFFASLIK